MAVAGVVLAGTLGPAAVAGGPPASAAGPRAERTGASRPRLGTPAPARATRSIADEQADRYLTVRPEVGPTVVVDPAGATLGERRLLTSLQGLVNRSEARMYVLTHPTDAAWIDQYETDGLVDVVDRTGLSGALARFASEATGYLLVDEAEPWTINVGTSLASLRGALVATPESEAELAALGLPLLDDLRGRWSDAETAYVELVDQHRDELPYPGVAVLQPRDSLYDFAYQQGMAIVFTRPSQPGWETMADLITSYPPGHPVYGYTATDGLDEAISVARLSGSGRFLMPTDTTSNLSYHVAVGRDRPRAVVEPPSTDGVAPCSADDVNVVIAISDGDNLALPTKVYRETGQWDAPERGTIPLGWSTSPALALLAPAIWDHYVETATDRDELVPVIGMGYAIANLLPDPDAFYETSFAWNAELGMRGFWSFSARTARADSPEIARIDRVAGDGPPEWLLVDYNPTPGAPANDVTPGGRPMAVAGNLYSDTPEVLAERVRELLRTDPADRPLVTFFSAAVWNTSAAGLATEMLPLEQEGVRFLTPSEAAACRARTETDEPVLPDAPPAAPVPGDATFTG